MSFYSIPSQDKHGRLDGETRGLIQSQADRYGKPYGILWQGGNRYIEHVKPGVAYLGTIQPRKGSVPIPDPADDPEVRRVFGEKQEKKKAHERARGAEKPRRKGGPKF